MSVIFDQLRISDDGKRMYINLHVNAASYFDNIYLDSLTIMTADKVLETDPKAPTEEYIYKKVFDGNQKTADLVLTAADFIKTWEEDPSAMKFPESAMSSTLFFVYVKIKGVPDECTPCSLDEEVTVGVTFDTNVLYQMVMNFTRDLADDCVVPTGFTDFILQWNAFKAAVETEHYIPAINFWNQMFGEDSAFKAYTSSYGKIKPCGCHG